MNLENVPEKSKEVLNSVTNAVEERGKQVIEKVSHLTEQKASEVTEEAIVVAVDQAIDVMQIASQRVREKDFPTEKVSLEVGVSIVSVINLKMQTDVPITEELKDVNVELTESSNL